MDRHQVSSRTAKWRLSKNLFLSRHVFRAASPKNGECHVRNYAVPNQRSHLSAEPERLCAAKYWVQVHPLGALWLKPTQVLAQCRAIAIITGLTQQPAHLQRLSERRSNLEAPGPRSHHSVFAAKGTKGVLLPPPFRNRFPWTQAASSTRALRSFLGLPARLHQP